MLEAMTASRCIYERRQRSLEVEKMLACYSPSLLKLISLVLLILLPISAVVFQSRQCSISTMILGERVPQEVEVDH